MENSSCCYISQIEHILPIEVCENSDLSLALDLTKSCMPDDVVPYMKENVSGEQKIVLQLDVSQNSQTVTLQHNIITEDQIETLHDASAIENTPMDISAQTGKQVLKSYICSTNDENYSKKRKSENKVKVKEKCYNNEKNFKTFGKKRNSKNEMKYKLKCTKNEMKSNNSKKLKTNPESFWEIGLPDIVLHKIFMMVTYQEGSVPFLFRMGQMCSLWRNVSLSSSLWHTVDLSGSVIKESYRTTKVLQWLCENRLQAVEDLNLGGWKMVNVEQAIEAIATNCKRLHSLGLSGWHKLTLDHILFAVINCPNLRNIDISNCSHMQSNIPANSVTTLGSIKTVLETMGDRLTHFNMSNNVLRQQPAKVFHSVIANCPNLQVLDLSNVISVMSIGKISINGFQENCKNLRVLRLANCSVDTTVTSAEYSNASGFPLLEELSVAVDGSFPYINDLTLNAILKESYNLKLLDVRGCPHLTDSGILGIQAPNLEFLFLSGSAIVKPQNARLQPIIHKWSHSLIEIDLSWAASKVELNTAVEKFALLGKDCPLKVLTLCGTGIELSTIKEVVAKCPNLISLNLSSCRELPRGMKHPYEGKREIGKILRTRLNN